MSPVALVAGLAGISAVVGLSNLLILLGERQLRRRSNRPTSLRVLARVGHGLRLSFPLKRLESKLLAAGSPLGLSMRDFAAIKAGCAVVLTLAFLPWLGMLPGRLPIVALLALPVAGFFLPDYWLARLARKRVQQIDREFADVVDLLRVSVAAGLPFGRALTEVSRRHAGVFAHELATTARQVDLGVPVSVALDRMAVRCPAAGVPALVAAMQRTARQGVPLGDVLSAQAKEARSLTTTLIREGAAKAAPKIQVVVAMLMVPAVLLQIAAALVVEL